MRLKLSSDIETVVQKLSNGVVASSKIVKTEAFEGCSKDTLPMKIKELGAKRTSSEYN